MAKTILVIDDEKDLVDLLETRLEVSGYSVLTAYTGKEGLEKANETKPNLIVLDVIMPAMDGFETLRMLKASAETHHIPVIMLTSRGETEALLKADKLGSADYIIKPFEPEELLKMLKRYV